MALTAALKAQIAAWYKALQEQIPDFIPRAPQRQMIADVARTLAGEEGRHLAIEAPTGVGKTLSYLIPGIAIAREEQKHWWSVPLTWRYRIRSLAKICRCYENHPRSALYRRLWPRALRVSAKPGGARQ